MRDDPDDEDWHEFAKDGPEPWEECGRWDNGRVTRNCALAGTEHCDFVCPFRGL